MEEKKWSGHWKGGRRITKHGYVEIYAPNHPMVRGNGYISEHRLVMTKELGRSLDGNEVVHHINGNRTDNRIDNLEIMTNSEHAKLHFREKREQQHRRDTMDPQDRAEFESEFGPDVEALSQEAQELGIDIDINAFLGIEGGDNTDMTQ